MKCPLAVETVFNEDYKPSYQRMMDCDERCMLRVMTGDGESMCAFQCAQNSLHSTETNLERIAYTLDELADAASIFDSLDNALHALEAGKYKKARRYIENAYYAAGNLTYCTRASATKEVNDV